MAQMASEKAKIKGKDEEKEKWRRLGVAVGAEDFSYFSSGLAPVCWCAGRVSTLRRLQYVFYLY
jgi:hypothetical protein